MREVKGRNEQIGGIRLIVFKIIIGLIIFIYGYHLFSMQVIENYVYEDRANQVSNRSVVIPSQRGEIYDSNRDIPVATNRSSFTIEVSPAALLEEGKRDQLLINLLEVTNVDHSFLASRIPAPSSSYDPVAVLTGVNYNTISYIAERIDNYPGISWSQQPIRIYPQGELLSQIIGYVGDITQEELQVLFNQGYNRVSTIGKAGIERSYDSNLRGEDGVLVRQVDVFGRTVGLQEGAVQRPPELGDSLVLTIDRHLQELVSRALGERVGSALVLKPSTGEILAMANYPTFDPNNFYGPTGSLGFSKIRDDSRSPFLNRAIQSAAPPASTFKILLSIAALEENLIDPMDEVICEGHVDIGDRRFNCWNRSGHGPVNLYEALAQSCNVYFYNLGYEVLKEDLIVEYANLLGFGTPTNIDIPGEARGLVPTKEWKERTYNVPWVGGDTVNLSIGQGYLTSTPIQLANMIASIVNDGVVYQPHIVKEIRDSVSFRVITENKPEILRQINLSSSTLNSVKQGMRKVIVDGTANVVITTDAVEVAAKTGTAQTGAEGSKHSWFVAYAPYNTNNPDDQIIVVVWVDAQNEWEWWAPKAANIILHGYFTGQNYEDTLSDLMPLWYL